MTVVEVEVEVEVVNEAGKAEGLDAKYREVKGIEV